MKHLFTGLLIISYCTSFAQVPKVFDKKLPSDLAQEQLVAYNNRDIEAFLIPYSDSVRIYNFPNELLMSGKDDMRRVYSNIFSSMKNLRCTLEGRSVNGNIVIDQERVFFDNSRPVLKTFALYKIRNNKIQEVYFIRPD